MKGEKEGVAGATASFMSKKRNRRESRVNYNIER